MVNWVPGVQPKSVNAWSFVNAASQTSSSTVLSSHLGPTFDLRRGAPIQVTWSNLIPAMGAGSSLLSLPPINPTPSNQVCGSVVEESPIGVVVHLHGARVQAGGDGFPLSPLSFVGNPYGFPTSLTYSYPNSQRAAMLWFHDHSMDNTGKNVYAGLVGVYFLRDRFDDQLLNLIGGRTHELPLILQDAVLNASGTGVDYTAATATDPAIYTDSIRAEALGNVNLINGFPAQYAKFSLDKSVWRFRVLGGSNARTYALAVCDPVALQKGSGRVWYSDCLRLIGSDSGLISRSVPLAADDVLLVAPGQRRDVLMDLSRVPDSVPQLQIVNLNLQYLLDATPTNPEAIFTDFDNSVVVPESVDYSPLDQVLYGALKLFPVASVAQINIAQQVSLRASGGIDAVGIDALLQSAASDDDFDWDGAQFVPRAGAVFGPNRLVLAMSDIEGFQDTDGPVVNGTLQQGFGNGMAGWSDVQLLELIDDANDPAPDNGAWQLPFFVDLATNRNPSPISVPEDGSQTSYTIARRSFFQQRTNPDIVVSKKYPPIHEPAITPKAGTYERWYVANIGNSQPLTDADGDPDMHPFHIHLVSFVVLRRWQLDGSGFAAVPPTDLNLDRIARQDTVMIPSGQLVELLVYYPSGFSGDYVYHCHLLEHEDKCMMSSFRVAP